MRPSFPEVRVRPGPGPRGPGFPVLAARSRLGLLTLFALVVYSGFGGPGCLETRCKEDLACPVGERCNAATGKCFAVDSGVAHPVDAATDGTVADAAVDAAPDAAPPCEGSGSCTDPQAPICDQGTGACRACTPGSAGDGECAARDTDLPVCEGTSGACVECTDSAAHCTGDLGEPVCDQASHACRACTPGSAGDGECAARDSDLPVCEGTSGACVECTDSAAHCTASAQEPICDSAGHACRGCEGHAECAPPLGGGVCDAATGRCLAESEVIYVNEDACPQAGTGTRTDPFCDLQDGVDAVTTGQTTVLVAAGTYAPITVVDAGTVWIVGEAGAVVRASYTPSSGVYVTGTSDLTIEGFTVLSEGGTGVGLECDGNITVHPMVTLRGCTITNNSGGGVSATSCEVTLDGNDIRGNAGGGIYLGQSSFTVVNNFVVLNGGAATSYGGLRIASPGTTAIFEFNTVASNDAQSGEGGIVCYQAFTVGSSILVANTDGDSSSQCTLDHSFTTSDGNPNFVGSGDYHLSPGSPCIDAGDPASSLDHDVDGQARPLGLGPDIGADEAM